MRVITAVILCFFQISGYVPPAYCDFQPRGTAVFKHPQIQGFSYDPEDPFDIDFLVVNADNRNFDSAAQYRLLRYFFAALAIDEKKLWVNLGPDEKDRIIDPVVEKTEIGQVLLEQDLILKQLSSSLTHPDTPTGRVYWGIENGSIQISTERAALSKIWIKPDEITIFDHGNLLYIDDISLKVQSQSRNDDALIPLLTYEVNHGDIFAELRQMLYSAVAAQCFKKKFSQVLIDFYYDSEKISGMDLNDPYLKEEVFNKYKESFLQGSYDIARKEIFDGRLVKRRYFSGGVYAGIKDARIVSVNGNIPDARVTVLSSAIDSPVFDAQMLKLISLFEDFDAESAADPLQFKSLLMEAMAQSDSDPVKKGLLKAIAFNAGFSDIADSPEKNNPVIIKESSNGGKDVTVPETLRDKRYVAGVSKNDLSPAALAMSVIGFNFNNLYLHLRLADVSYQHRKRRAGGVEKIFNKKSSPVNAAARPYGLLYENTIGAGSLRTLDEVNMVPFVLEHGTGKVKYIGAAADKDIFRTVKDFFNAATEYLRFIKSKKSGVLRRMPFKSRARAASIEMEQRLIYTLFKTKDPVLYAVVRKFAETSKMIRSADVFVITEGENHETASEYAEILPEIPVYIKKIAWLVQSLEDPLYLLPSLLRDSDSDPDLMNNGGIDIKDMELDQIKQVSYTSSFNRRARKILSGLGGIGIKIKGSAAEAVPLSSLVK